jgi:hypothetical protein
MKKLITAAAGLFLLAAQLPTPASVQARKLSAIGTVTVAAVRDGRMLLLGDGRELRLAAIEPADLPVRPPVSRYLARQEAW